MSRYRGSRRCGPAIALAAAALGLVACSTSKPWLNEPLAPGEDIGYDGLAELFDPARAVDLLVVASFSGGGSRAAAFAHATLSELESMPFDWGGGPTTLAREIDMVTGVSGGSVAATHLALHGVGAHLRNFRGDFLAVDFQGQLVRTMLGPAHLHRMTSPWQGRSQLVIEQFDRRLFHGATFGDLRRLPGRPYLIVGATDLATGGEFDFASDQFAALCSQLDAVPLAFAVAASSAVPLLLSPLTLRSHADACLRRDAAAGAGVVAPATPRERLVRSEFDSYGSAARRYVHLVDGGVSDNLGLRRIADYVAQAGGIGAVLTMLRGAGPTSAPLPRRIVFLSVNSERHGPRALDSMDRVPDTFQVARELVAGGLGRYSRETSLVFDDAVERWRRELRALAGDDVDIFDIEVDLATLADDALRERVASIPTAFRISPADLAELQRAARASLAQSAELRRFMRSTQAAAAVTR